MHSTLRNKSIFNPPVKDKHIEVFKRVVLEELKELKIRKKEDLKNIKSGIRKLTKRKDLVIRPADKGRGIVVLSKEQYSTSMNSLLQDEDTYSCLLGNPIFKCRKALEQTVHLGLKINILTKKEAKNL